MRFKYEIRYFSPVEWNFLQNAVTAQRQQAILLELMTEKPKQISDQNLNNKRNVYNQLLQYNYSSIYSCCSTVHRHK